MSNAALKLFDEPIEELKPDSAVYLRAKYLQSLEKELEGWVRKCEQAFEAGFNSGKKNKLMRWEDAFDSWIKERREPCS